jgi:hypothetical protein
MSPTIPSVSADVPTLAARIEGLGGDERLILDMLLARLEFGRHQYGPWIVDDGRDYPAEAYEEVLDGMHYCAAEIVRRRRLAESRRRRIYVCHPYANDPPRNVERVRGICRQLVAEGYLPIAPHLYLPAFIDEATERELALSLCLELVDLCDEVRVFGTNLTIGMGREIQYAKQRGIPVQYDRRSVS